MVKQVLLPILAVIAFIALVGFYLQKSNYPNLASKFNSPTSVSAKTISISDRIIKVEIAATPELRAKGLSGRTSLAESSGMLFVFDSKDVMPSFWMKDMLMPLDIIWINDGKIVKIDKNVNSPTQGTPNSKLRIYKSLQPVDYVLEVAGGFSNLNHIQVGDPADLSKAL